MKGAATLARVVAIASCALVAGSLSAQFTPDLFTNESYWGDGKAEFDLYDATLMRGGQARKCELLMIVAREQVDPKTFGRLEDARRTDALSTIRLQQLWSAALGLFAEQGSIVARWRADTGALLRLSFAGTDSFGNISRRVEAAASPVIANSETVRDGVSANPIVPPPDALYYDELPFRVRTLDWRKPPASFEVALAPALQAASTIEFKPAKVNWRPTEKNVEVTVQHAGGTDQFHLDQQFPFLLRDWEMADGSKLHLKRGLKADYWNYGKNGDRERALKNPMLEHPD